MLGNGPPAARNDPPPVTVRATGLTKRYGDVIAVDGLDLTVSSGEVYGFLGRNGAGKTTTIRMLVGLVHPTGGSVEVLGRDVRERRRSAGRAIGSLVETATAYANLTVRENLEIQRRLTRSPIGSIDRVVDLLGLEEVAGRPAGHLSLGNQQRLGLARALLARPPILILDEPANGLDPAGIVEIRRLLRRLADEDDVTVFVSSHILAEVRQLVDRIGIIHRGRLVEEIDMASIGLSTRLMVHVNHAARAREALSALAGAGGVTDRGSGTLELDCGSVPAAVVVRTLVEAGLDVSAACPLHEDLEARFLRLTAEPA